MPRFSQGEVGGEAHAESAEEADEAGGEAEAESAGEADEAEAGPADQEDY